jgi:acyl dehydratase
MRPLPAQPVGQKEEAMAISGLDLVEVGKSYSFAKTVTETDVALFAGLSGDFGAVHVNEQYVRENTTLGGRIAHGVLIIGLMSTASTIATEHIIQRPDLTDFAVSLGYDRIRFVRPVYLGDTITVRYTIQSVDRQRRRDIAEVEATNQRGEIVAVAEHVMSWPKK